MLNNNIKLLIIKKIRDLYFLFRFGKGSYFFRYITTLMYCSIKRVLINKKIDNIKKKITIILAILGLTIILII